jgi:ferritin-like metal-binding protein YciE
MKLVVEKLPDLQALYVKQLRLLLSAGEVIAMKMPFVIQNVTDPEFNRFLRDHLPETEKQVQRVRTILHRLTREADPLKCKVSYCLFDEIEEAVAEAEHEPVRDAAMLAEVRRVEHYEIAAYSALLQFAQVLGSTQDAQLHEQTLREEALAEQRLSRMSDRIYAGARTL